MFDAYSGNPIEDVLDEKKYIYIRFIDVEMSVRSRQLWQCFCCPFLIVVQDFPTMLASLQDCHSFDKKMFRRQLPKLSGLIMNIVFVVVSMADSIENAAAVTS